MSLVLLPGFMLDEGLWDDVREALAPFGPLVFGDLFQDGSIEGMARRVLATAPPSFALVGFSMGGYVAREIVRQAPGRVTALILIATSARGDTPERSMRKRFAAKQVERATFKGLSRPAVVSSLHPARAQDEGLIGRMLAMGSRLGGDVFLRQAMLQRDGDLDRLDDIRCPTLVIAADRDALRSLAEAEELARGIPGAELRVIEGSGHMLPMEVPAELAATMRDWLASVASA
jgi:pimeloyl-ACP methyl ester carboxylesterase